VRVVREDPGREGLLYAGTEFGMFISFDDGARWHPFQLNLPITPVTDIKLVNNDLVMSTMGRGFWILYDLLPLHEATSELASAKVYLFRIREAYRLYFSGRSASRADAPNYPSPGANIDYYLGEDVKDEVRLRILDADGTVIREYSSEKKPFEGEGVRSLIEPSASIGDPSPDNPRLLEKTQGFHRFVWDLRWPGPWGEDPTRSRGPMVSPGWYEVHLFSGVSTVSHKLEVSMDPRVLAEGIGPADVKAQEELALKVRDSISEARRLAKRLVTAIESSEGETLETLNQIKSDLMTEPVRYSKPKLIDQLKYLYENLMRADQRPGIAADERFKELDIELKSALARANPALGK
jgi:hypothetical protein